MSVDEFVPPADSMGLGLLNDVVGPLVMTGETVAVRPTVPVNPFRLVRETVDMLDDPRGISRNLESTSIRKSACEVPYEPSLAMKDTGVLVPLDTVALRICTGLKTPVPAV